MNKKMLKLAKDISNTLNEGNVRSCAISSWKALQQSGGLSKLDHFIREIREARAHKQNQEYVRVLSARELSEQEKQAVVKTLDNKTGKATIVDYAIDKKILGGVVIKTKDEILDMSWKGKLEQLKINLEST